MPIYHTLGKIPRKRHIAFRQPDGGLYAEELMGHEGFTGRRRCSTTRIRRPRSSRLGASAKSKCEADPDQTLRHRHFRTSRVKKGGSPTLDRDAAAVQSGHRDAVRRARRERRALLPERAGRRAACTSSKGSGVLETRVRRPPLSARATTSSSIAASCTGGVSTWAASSSQARWSSRAAGTCAGPSATATNSGSSSKARRTRERDIRRPAAASSRTTRRATSRFS